MSCVVCSNPPAFQLVVGALDSPGTPEELPEGCPQALQPGSGTNQQMSADHDGHNFKKLNKTVCERVQVQ